MIDNIHDVATPCYELLSRLRRDSLFPAYVQPNAALTGKLGAQRVIYPSAALC